MKGKVLEAPGADLGEGGIKSQVAPAVDTIAVHACRVTRHDSHGARIQGSVRMTFHLERRASSAVYRDTRPLVTLLLRSAFGQAVGASTAELGQGCVGPLALSSGYEYIFVVRYRLQGAK